MAIARSSLSRRLHSLLFEPQSPLCVYHIIHSPTPPPTTTHQFPPFHHRTVASSSKILNLPDTVLEQNDNEKAKMKREAVGLSKETVQSDRVNKEVKKKLRRSKAKLKGKEGKGIDEGEEPKKVEAKRLYDFFNVHKEDKRKKAKPSKLSHEMAPLEKHKEVEQKEPVVLKELSPEMERFVYHLYKEGYFNDANFFKRDKFDPRWFDTMYARQYMLFAAQKFGKDKQEISKWLSGSDLKHLAMFGCPSVNKSVVIPAKRLRYFFKIPEESVCSKCKLRDSCSFVNKQVWTSGNNTLDLALAMKIICSYALLFVHPQLVLPDETNKSVGRLLNEVQKLSRTVCKYNFLP